MYIKVKELLQMKRLNKFNLLAGEGGLDRKVKKVCLLDHEIVNPINKQFYEHEFALSSLLGAKDNEALILKSVKYLTNSGVSGLAVKNIYYDQLPNKVIEYANDNNFPILMIDNSVFFEDIITDLRDLLRDLEKGKNLEHQLDKILKEPATDNDNKELLYEIAGLSNLPYQVLYVTEREKHSKSQLLPILESFRNFKIEAVKGLIKYHEGIIMIYSTKKFNRKLLNVDLSNLLINPQIYRIGISQIFDEGSSFTEAVKQALHSLRVAEVENRNQISYNDIGIYKLITAFEDNKLFTQYADDIIKPVIEYDKKHNTELLVTGNIFIKNEGNIKKTAEELFLHDNTIRYRINTIKKIVNMELQEDCFYEQFSIALKIMKVKGLEF